MQWKEKTRLLRPKTNCDQYSNYSTPIHALAIQTAVAHEIINELGYGDGAATTAARGAAAEAEMNADEGTGEDDAAWAAGEGDGLGGREGA